MMKGSDCEAQRQAWCETLENVIMKTRGETVNEGIIGKTDEHWKTKRREERRKDRR